jgi:hypothetical protein
MKIKMMVMMGNLEKSFIRLIANYGGRDITSMPDASLWRITFLCGATFFFSELSLRESHKLAYALASVMFFLV